MGVRDYRWWTWEHPTSSVNRKAVHSYAIPPGLGSPQQQWTVHLPLTLVAVVISSLLDQRGTHSWWCLQKRGPQDRIQNSSPVVREGVGGWGVAETFNFTETYRSRGSAILPVGLAYLWVTRKGMLLEQPHWCQHTFLCNISVGLSAWDTRTYYFKT